MFLLLFIAWLMYKYFTLGDWFTGTTSMATWCVREWTISCLKSICVWLLCSFVCNEPYWLNACICYLGGAQTNNTARTNPTSEARAPSVAGLGGLGLPELERTGIPDSSTFSQLLQNPAVAQMMQSLLSNPQYLDQVQLICIINLLDITPFSLSYTESTSLLQILGLNPQLRSMFDMNPQLREMMQNPEMLRELTSPNTMQVLNGCLNLSPLNSVLHGFSSSFPQGVLFVGKRTTWLLCVIHKMTVLLIILRALYPILNY